LPAARLYLDGRGRGEGPDRRGRLSADLAPEEPRVISVRELTKAYGNVLAVDRVSFEVPRGQIVGFLGPNGAGKSTTLRMLTCYMPPTSGGATVNGFDIFYQSEQVRHHLGYLPENGPLYPEMTPRSLLRFFGDARGMSRELIDERMDKVIDLCQLGSVIGKPIGKLSKGFRQRVGMAQVLLHEPDVLILDEPTAGLDPIGAAAFDQLILTLRESLGLTVFLITHDLDTLYTICDRVAVLSQKRVLVADTLDKVERCDDEWVQEYFQGPRGRAAERAVSSSNNNAAGAAPTRV